MNLISLVVPVYHEEETLPIFLESVNKVIASLKDEYEFEIVFVCDMPDYGMFEALIKKQKEQSNIVVVRLSRSFGHEEAVASGLKIAKGDAVIPLDGDLQDDPNTIPLMLKKWKEGYQVVNGKRSSREEKGLSKFFVNFFYYLFHKWSKKINVPKNVGDFRLLDRVVVDELNKIESKFRVLKIDVPYVGFKICEVEYVRKNRVGGKTHYKKLNLFRNAIDYFAVISDEMLFVLFKVGFIAFALSILTGLALLIVFILQKAKVGLNISNTGYLVWFIVFISTFLFSLLEFSLFAVGCYANRAFKEADSRPTYIIESVTYAPGKKDEK